MIETTYVRLAQAAAMLDTDADTLLIAAAEGRIQLYFLMNRFVFAQKGYFEDLNDPSIDKSSWSWVPVEEKIEHFKFVTLPPEDAADLLIKNAVEWGSNSTFLSIEAADGTSWACDPGEPLLTQGCQEWRVISKNAVFLSRADVEAIKAAHATPAPDTIKNAPIPDRSHISDWLALLNQAARRWWANAVRHDPATHPSNAAVAAWLIEKGMTKSLAERAASIIRPEWAHTGRKPDA